MAYDFWSIIMTLGVEMAFPIFIVYGLLLNDRFWRRRTYFRL